MYEFCRFWEGVCVIGERDSAVTFAGSQGRSSREEELLSNTVLIRKTMQAGQRPFRWVRKKLKLPRRALAGDLWKSMRCYFASARVKAVGERWTTCALVLGVSSWRRCARYSTPTRRTVCTTERTAASRIGVCSAGSRRRGASLSTIAVPIVSLIVLPQPPARRDRILPAA